MSGAGHSKGADSVVTYAAKYDDVPRVVNVSGRFDMHTGGACPLFVVWPHTGCHSATESSSVLQASVGPPSCYVRSMHPLQISYKWTLYTYVHQQDLHESVQSLI